MVWCTEMAWSPETPAQSACAPLARVVACIPQVAGNLRARFRADHRGGGVLDLGYRGPLVSSGPVWIRVGEARGGLDWLEPRDLLMESRDGQAIAHVVFAPGAELEGLSFAFHVARPGGGGRIWDNAGRPYGSYTLDLATGEIAAQ